MRSARTLALPLATALAIRLAFIPFMPAEIPWPDGRQYDAVARSLVEHGTYGMQTLRPPGYPTFMAGVYAVLGTDLARLRVVEAFVGTLAVAVIAQVGAMLFGARAGWVAGWLAALHPVLAFLPSTQYSENLLVLVLAAAFGAVFLAARSAGIALWAAGGALFGIAALIRPNTVMLLPGLGIGLAWARRRGGRAAAPGALAFAAALILVLAPWVVRNHQVHGHWFFVATGGGRAAWLGNNPETTGATSNVTWPDSARLAEMMGLPDEVAQKRLWYAWATDFVREHPGRAARPYLVKLGNLFALYPETYTRTPYVNHASRIAQGAMSLAVFIGALLALRWRREPTVWVLVGAITTFTLVNALFFTVMRYRMAFEPCLLWLAGAGWSAAWELRARHAGFGASAPLPGAGRGAL